MFRLLHPEYLLLLVLVPLMWWGARSVRVLGRGRKQLALILRSVVVVFFVLALAEVERVDKGENLAVFFVLDRSSSIPQDEQDFTIAYVQEQLSAIPQDDQAGIIFFGKEAAIQDIPRENVTLEEYQTLVNSEGTDIESALGLAMAAFPDGVQKRLVLVTDGNQTEGNALEAAKRVVASGIDLQILPLRYTFTQDVLVEAVNIPSQINAEEPFDVRVLVKALEAGRGTLRLMENGQVIAEQEVEFKPGKNAFIFTRTIDQSGAYTYEATVEAEHDRRPSNNRAQTFALVEGMPQVLLLETEPELGLYLAASLQAEGIQVEMRTPAGLPGSLRQLQAYDSVILSNVPASQISEAKQEMLDTAVRDLGIGLVMIGGPNSFGAGGWLDTPVERALPVTMDIKQRRVIPSGALAMITHSSEIPQGNMWAREIALAALNVLSRNDYCGFLFYDTMQGGATWLFDMQKVGDKTMMRNSILSLASNAVGDMPSFITTMQMAYNSLNKISANTKHIIILSDGDPARPTPNLMNQITEAGITISTVCINPHSPRDNDVMRAISQQGGGEHYYVQNYDELPQIFIKEAAVVRRNLIVEESFTPALTSYSEIVQGFDQGFPQLDGYVAVGARDQAEQILVTHNDDPLLAQWQYGLGKSVAFTADAKPRWARSWLNWDGYGKFWGQLVRWTLPSSENQNFEISTRLDGNQVHVVVDALTSEGEFLNGLNFSASGINPDFVAKDFEMRQTGPGRYEGRFTVEDPGSYLANLNYQTPDGEEGRISTGVTVPFSPEHKSTSQNDVLLNRLRQLNGQPYLTPQTNVFTHNLDAVSSMQPLWPWLLGLAIVLFFFDVAVRRVFFDLTQLQTALRRAWQRALALFSRQAAPAVPASEQMGQLMQAKSRSFEPSQPQAAEREELFQRLDQTQEQDLQSLESSQPSTAPWHKAKLSEESPQQFEDQPQDEYTSALFRAKDRAKKRTNQ